MICSCLILGITHFRDAVGIAVNFKGVPAVFEAGEGRPRIEHFIKFTT
jgi:hypothetical protein